MSRRPLLATLLLPILLLVGQVFTPPTAAQVRDAKGRSLLAGDCSSTRRRLAGFGCLGEDWARAVKAPASEKAGVTDDQAPPATQDALSTHLPALIDVAGKSLASVPAAKEAVAELRRADDHARFVQFLEEREAALGVDKPAAEAIVGAARDEERWRETYARMLDSAERHLTERFHSSA